MAVDADGNALLTFYDGEGGVHLARQDGASWSVAKIADAPPLDDAGNGNLAPMTGVAVDDEGGLAAAWEDARRRRARDLRRRGRPSPRSRRSTPTGGRSPSVGISPDGANVFVAWFDPDGENLRFGVQGDLGGARGRGAEPDDRSRRHPRASRRRWR